MKDFKYCIWYSPPANHPWNYFTNGFPPHMSIKTGLNLSQALSLFSKLKKISINIEFDNLRCNEDDGFHALYYTIKDIENKPLWWPKNPHMSFYYKYNQKITTSEANYLYINLHLKKSNLSNFHVVLCKGHHSKWKIIASK